MCADVLVLFSRTSDVAVVAPGMLDTPWFATTGGTPFPIHQRTSDLHPWLTENEGALAVDVHEYEDAIVVRAPIAGVRPEDLDLSLHNDMLTVRGKRTDIPEEGKHRTLHQECHWGSFSRSVILPVAVRGDEATATLVDGVLTVRLPKATRHGIIPILKT